MHFSPYPAWLSHYYKLHNLEYLDAVWSTLFNDFFEAQISTDQQQYLPLSSCGICIIVGRQIEAVVTKYIFKKRGPQKKRRDNEQKENNTMLTL